jgi:hypothetical protein
LYGKVKTREGRNILLKIFRAAIAATQVTVGTIQCIEHGVMENIFFHKRKSTGLPV